VAGALGLAQPAAAQLGVPIQEPRPLPLSLLQEPAPTLDASVPVRPAERRPVLPTSAETTQPKPAPSPKPVELPTIIYVRRQPKPAPPPLPEITQHGCRLPQIISMPLRLPEIRSGVAWPMRSTLVLPLPGKREPGAPAPAPEQWFELAGMPGPDPVLPAPAPVHLLPAIPVAAPAAGNPR
jgi:hypothetical protein